MTLLFSSNHNCSSPFRHMFYINVHCWCFLISSSPTLCSNTCQSAPSKKRTKKNKHSVFYCFVPFVSPWFFTWKGVTSLWPFKHRVSPMVRHGDPTGALHLMHLPWLLLIGPKISQGNGSSISHLDKRKIISISAFKRGICSFPGG